MDSQNWTGFDRRKICRRCGGYQTRFGRYEAAETPPRLLGILRLLAVVVFVLQVGIAFLLANQGQALNPMLVTGLLITVILALGIFTAYRVARRSLGGYGRAIRRLFHLGDPDEDLAQESPSLNPAAIMYSLHCNHCGYRWQKTAQEWEREGQRDVEDLASHPPVLPAEDQAIREDLEKIEWKPPNQARTILIITGVVIVFLLVVTAIALWLLTGKLS